MATTIRLKDGVVILEPNGKIIGTAVSELREKLASQLDASDAACILINFEHVNQMDSSGLGMLVNTRAVAARKEPYNAKETFHHLLPSSVPFILGI